MLLDHWVVRKLEHQIGESRISVTDMKSFESCRFCLDVLAFILNTEAVQVDLNL